KAAELVGRDRTEIPTTSGPLHARMVRFRRGDSVLELTLPGGGSSMSRIFRKLRGPSELEVVANYLLRAFADEGLEPIA
ncbi:MAG TPA: hypothetical protein VMU14_18495, partial [Acidimicrobiales bacterium]|nr:hypothetical protein [Acidimicrobiales bacterium]